MLTKIDLYKLGDHMTPALWDTTTHFKYDEDWGDPYKMWVHLIYYLDAFRIYIHPHKLIVNCGWELRESGWHPSGAAADLHCPTLDMKFLTYRAMQFPFTGIGMYPYWHKPGVHLDVRPLQLDCRRRVWWRDEWKEMKEGKVIHMKKYYNVENLEEFDSVSNVGSLAFR
jgi:hypothetical protein